MFKMQGCIPPMITPFKENGDLDEEGLRTLVDFLSHHVHGLFICGSYGAGALMSIDERKRVAEITKEVAKDRVKVIVQTGTTNNRATAELTRHAHEIGADAVAAVGPYYYKFNEESILSFYKDMVDAAQGVPVYVYNNPQFQGYPMSLDLLQKMKDLGVQGVKDATFDIMTHAKYHRILGPQCFDVVLGTEAMWLSACVLGTEAFIPGLANAFPEICVKMYEEGMKKDFEKCRETQFEVNRLRDIMYLAKSTQLAIYAMLEIRGVLKCYPRKPFIGASREQKEAIRVELDKLGLL